MYVVQEPSPAVMLSAKQINDGCTLRTHVLITFLSSRHINARIEALFFVQSICQEMTDTTRYFCRSRSILSGEDALITKRSVPKKGGSGITGRAGAYPGIARLWNYPFVCESAAPSFKPIKLFSCSPENFLLGQKRCCRFNRRRDN